MPRRQPNQLGKFLRYVLGHRPDEFGLIPDPEGFFQLKELLQAIAEEPGWSYVRLADIREMLMIQQHQFELRDDRIRLTLSEASGPPIALEPAIPPEILYYGARQKAYPHILENGLRSISPARIRLTVHKEFALRIGRRRDPKPVLIRVHAASAHDEGVVFFRFLEHLYIADFVPPIHLEGPPLPKEKPSPPPRETPKEKGYQPAGSFFLELKSIPERLRREKQKRSESWKKEAKRYRKEREKGR